MRTLAGAAVLAAAVTGTAQAGSKPVVVVSTKSYRLLAWDSGRKICTEISAVAHTSSACGSPRARTFTQLPFGVGNETFVGGVTSSKARSVDVVFANGATLHVKARVGHRYRGRRHSRVRFFAAREKAVTSVSSLTAKDRHGHTVQTVQVTPPPGTPVPPEPPPNPKPCGCPPPTELKACPQVICPYASPAWTRNL
jgi:hypothetical protein